MPKFLMKETVTNDLKAFTVRLGAGTGDANNVTSKEQGKLVKLVGDSRYDLAVLGDSIEAIIVAVETPTQDGYSIGSVRENGRLAVTFDGTQAAGTGAIAVGDYVVVGTVVAKGTSLNGVPAKVRKATAQIGAVPADLTAAGLQAKSGLFAWRVVSLGNVGTGAVGTEGLIERVGANN